MNEQSIISVRTTQPGIAVMRYQWSVDILEPRQWTDASNTVEFTITGKVTVKEKSKKVSRISESLEAVDRRGIPAWLEVDKKAFEGTIKSMPAREDLTLPIQEQLIVELYSK